MKVVEQYQYIRLDVLSPVHVGSGEILDPLAYLMRCEESGPVFYTVDTAGWVESAEDPAALAELFDSMPLPAVRGYIRDNLAPAIYATSSCRVVDPGVFREYQDKLKDQRSDNQLKLSLNLRNQAQQTALVPGSSLKGAISTAIIDYLDRRYRLQLREEKEYREKLSKIVGGIQNSAFKAFKISDFESLAGSALIVGAREVRQNPKKQATPKDPCEVLDNRCHSGDSCAGLFGKVRLGQSDKTGLRIKADGIDERWDWNGLSALVTGFYQKRFKDEKEKFYKKPHFHKTLKAIEKLEPLILNPEPGDMILRVGHYSHIECVTVTANRPKTRPLKKGDGNYPWGTTRTLAGGIYPFGWVRLSPCSETEYLEGLAAKKEHDSKWHEQRAFLRLEVTAAKEAEMQRQREREEKKRAEEEAAARRQAELDNMSEEDRNILFLKEGRLNSDQETALFKSLESLDGDSQRKVALALKEHWQKNNRWEVKRKKKESQNKQFNKVQKVKEILDEKE